MQPHNPFWPKHTMKFKVGGGEVFPNPLKPKKGLGNPLIPLQQTKNVFTKGDFATDEQVRAAEAEAALAGNQALPNTQAAAMATQINAQQDLIQREAAKKSIRKTIFAGETGGFKPYGSAATGMSGKAF